LPACCRPCPSTEALESAAVASLGGRFSLERWAQRPTGSPHHTASAVALVGGGSPPRPGEISLAHHGVLFLDELPEFPRAALEALREPLETGTSPSPARRRRSEFPARFQLIAAMNPCPCGYLGSTLKACRCTPDQVLRYQGRLSGPLLDRIDLHVEVPALAASELLNAPPGEGTATIRTRCTQARERALAAPGQTQSGAAGAGHRRPRRAGPSRREVPQYRRGPSGLERTRDPPRAQGGAHHRRSGGCDPPPRSPMWPRRCSTGVPCARRDRRNPSFIDSLK
jgi:magnesium chelatase family protein